MFRDPAYKPILRPVEVFRLPDGSRTSVGVRDRSGMSDVVLTLSEPALHVLSLMDGENTCEDMRRQFNASYGETLSSETLRAMLGYLEQAHFLEGPGFEAYYQSRLGDYRRAGTREMPHAAAMGLVDSSGELFEEMLAAAEPQILPGPVRGLVAPHLDYRRGKPCYSAAYATLRHRSAPNRVVILGTNHLGRSLSVVGTASDFATPLGTTRCDTAFLEHLEKRCGDLRKSELDHLKEHSIELQLLWLQHLFGADAFEIVPFLCPDPCGPTGTVPRDGEGVDLRDFALALGELIADGDEDTLVIAGADLSHVGAAFGDEGTLDNDVLEEVRQHDQRALDRLETSGPSAFVEVLVETDNRTNVCSAGCIYALGTALPEASVTRLRYHQAVDQSSQTCVTCAALAFT